MLFGFSCFQGFIGGQVHKTGLKISNERSHSKERFVTNISAKSLEKFTEASTVNSSVSDYFALLKPRVMSLVVFTAFVGLILAPGEIHPFIAFVSILSIALGAGASGAINMWFDRDVDAVMARTCDRPIPQGHIHPSDALGFGIVVASLSVMIMALAVNSASALLLLFTICYYVFVYTMWLKRRTAQNIVIGGVAGALPPVIGWFSVDPSFSAIPIALFLIIFLWTPPHSWALALYRKEEYRKVHIPMLPATGGIKSTKIHTTFYTFFLVFVTSWLYVQNYFGEIYGICSILLNLGFIFYVSKLWWRYSESVAKSLFRYSILYLFLIFLSLILDHYFLAIL